MTSILELRNIKCSLEEGVNLFSGVNISVNQGSVPLLNEIGGQPLYTDPF